MSAKKRSKSTKDAAANSGCAPSAGSVMSDRQILNWIAGKLNSRKGANFRLTIQDNSDMGYKKNRISLWGGVGSKDFNGKGDTVRHALSAMIRSQNDKAEPTPRGPASRTQDNQTK